MVLSSVYVPLQWSFSLAILLLSHLYPEANRSSHRTNGSLSECWARMWQVVPWVQIRGRVIPITFKAVHTTYLPNTRRWKDRVWSSSRDVINWGVVYPESHSWARERAHIPERIGLCGPLSTKSVRQSCVSASTATSKYSPEGPETDTRTANKNRITEALKVYGR